MDADNGSVLTGPISVSTGGNFELDGSTLTGDINAYLNANVNFTGGSTLAATRADSETGTCPSAPGAGISVLLGSTIYVEGGGSSISGYLYVDTESSVALWGLTDFTNIDGLDFVLSYLGDNAAAANECDPP
jgi:hypothetical protein